jgi:hypothetical protein
MYFLYKNEYKIFKPVEITIRSVISSYGEEAERRKVERMNQFGL